MDPGYLFMVSQPNLSALEQSWLRDAMANGVCREAGLFVQSGLQDFPLKDLSAWPS